MEEKVLALLSEEFPEIDFVSSEALVDDGILDSLTITGIIAAFASIFLGAHEIMSFDIGDVFAASVIIGEFDLVCADIAIAR